MSQTWDDIDTAVSGDSPATGWPKALDRFSALVSTFWGVTAPTDITTPGMMWQDSTDVANPVCKTYYAGAFGVQLVHHVNQADINVQNYELQNARLHNISTTTTPSTGQPGRTFFNTTTDRMEIDNGTTVDNVHHGDVSAIAPMDLATGATAPTVTSMGTSPAAKGYQLDAIGESLLFRCLVPNDWVADSDMYFSPVCVLPSGETANDDIELTIDWVSCTVDSDELVTRTSTQATTAFDIGSNNTQYSVHKPQLTIDYDDASNPVSTGDALYLEVHLTTTGNLSNGVVITGGYLEYTRDK